MRIHLQSLDASLYHYLLFIFLFHSQSFVQSFLYIFKSTKSIFISNNVSRTLVSIIIINNSNKKAAVEKNLL